MKIAIIGAGHVGATFACAIIARTGATHYVIAAEPLRIVEAIVRDERSVLTVPTLVEKYDGIDDVDLGIPLVLGRGRVEHGLRARPSLDELAALRRSAEVLKAARARLQPETLPPTHRRADEEDS